MEIINFVTHILSCTRSSSLFDLSDQSGAFLVHSYYFLCSISLHTATNNIFSKAKITQTGVWKSRKPESGIGTGMGTGSGTGTGNGNGNGTGTVM